MAMLMKELDAFSIKDVRTAYTIYQVIKKAGISIEDIGAYSATAARTEKHTPRKPAKNAPDIFLKAGESEITALRCECGGQMVVEALCHKRAIKEKCIRLAVCSEFECPREVKIR